MNQVRRSTDPKTRPIPRPRSNGFLFNRRRIVSSKSAPRPLCLDNVRASAAALQDPQSVDGCKRLSGGRKGDQTYHAAALRFSAS